MIVKQNDFCTWIELYRANKKETYIESVLAACDNYSIEVELVKPLLNEQIIGKMEAEAVQRNYIKSSSRSLAAFL